jgi:hypothetical protein
MYFLSQTLFPGKEGSVGHFLAGLLYMFNPVLAAYHMVGGTEPWMIAYALGPLAFAFLVKALSDRTSKNAVLTGLVLSIASYTSVIWDLEVIAYFLLFYTLLRNVVARSRAEIVHSVKIWVVILGIFVSLNLFWVLPVLMELPTVYGANYRATGLHPTALDMILSTRTGRDLTEVLRLYSPGYDFGFQRFYMSDLSFLLGMTVALAAFLSLLKRTQHERDKILLAGCSVPFIALAAMFPDQLMVWYADLVKFLPYGRGFLPVDPKRYLLFGVVPSLAPLFGLTMRSFLDRIGKTGTRTPKFLDEQPGVFNIFVLPSPNNWIYDNYKWLPHNGTIETLYKTLWLSDLKKSVLFNAPNDRERAIYENQTQHVGRLLSLIGAKYLVFRTDIRDPIMWTPLEQKPVDYARVLSVLGQQKDLVLRHKYGEISLFENTETVSKLYVASRLISLIGDESLLVGITSVLPSFRTYGFVFPAQNLPSQRQALVDSSSMVVVGDPVEETQLGLTLPKDRTVFISSTPITHGNPYLVPQDWSGYGWLFIYWEGGQTQKEIAVDVRTIVNDDSSVYRIFFRDSFYGWKRLAFPLTAFEAWTGLPGWKNVVDLRIHPANGTYETLHIGPAFLVIAEAGLRKIVVNESGPGGDDHDAGTNCTGWMMDAVSYEVRCGPNQSGPQYVILNEPYHPGWDALSTGSDVSHLLMNGWSNGYAVNSADRAIVKIVFHGKQVFDIGASASIVAIT